MSILHFFKENFVANHASLFDLESYKHIRNASLQTGKDAPTLSILRILMAT